MNKQTTNSFTNSYEFTNNTFSNYIYEFSPDYDNDLSYIIFIYPKEIIIIKDFIEDELDKYEYEGSVIFHEYPDKIRIENIINDIYIAMSDRKSLFKNNKLFSFNISPKENSYLCQIINLIFYYELLNRRRRYKIIKNKYLSNYSK